MKYELVIASSSLNFPYVKHSFNPTINQGAQYQQLSVLDVLKQKNAYDLFMDLTYLSHRQTTGGLTIYDKEAKFNIEKRLHQLGFKGEDIYGLITLLNNGDDNVGEFTQDDLSFMYKHTDESYAKLLARRLNHNGYVLKINMTGDIKQDFETVNSIKRILLQTNLDTLVNFDKINAKSCNVWQVISDTPLTNDETDNVITLAFVHNPAKQSNFWLYKLLTLTEYWLFQRLPKENKTMARKRLAVTPSKIDLMLDIEKFISDNNDILNPLSNRAVDSQKYTESFVFSKTVEEATSTVAKTDIEDEKKSLWQKAKGVFIKDKKKNPPVKNSRIPKAPVNPNLKPIKLIESPVDEIFRATTDEVLDNKKRKQEIGSGWADCDFGVFMKIYYRANVDPLGNDADAHQDSTE